MSLYIVPYLKSMSNHATTAIAATISSSSQSFSADPFRPAAAAASSNGP